MSSLPSHRAATLPAFRGRPRAPSVRSRALFETPMAVLGGDQTVPTARFELEADDIGSYYASYELCLAPIYDDMPLTPYTRPYERLDIELDIDVDFTLELEMIDLMDLS